MHASSLHQLQKLFIFLEMQHLDSSKTRFVGSTRIFSNSSNKQMQNSDFILLRKPGLVISGIF